MTADTARRRSALAGLRLVAAREVRERGRSRSYLLSTALTLLVLGAMVVVPTLLEDPDVTYRVGAQGEGGEAVLATAEAIARQQVGDGGELTFDVVPYADDAAARAALADGDVELVLVDGERLLRQGAVGFSGSDLQDLLQQAAAFATLDDADVEQVAALLAGEPLPVEAVEGTAAAEAEQARALIAYGGMFLLYMAILLYGQMALTGVMEEKTSRVVEVLLATLRPWQLFAGKVVGIGLLGLAQFVLTIGWALVLVRVTGIIELPTLPLDAVAALAMWFVLGYGTYSVLYASAGALVGRVEDAQAVAGPIAFVAVAGFLASFPVLDAPAGTLAHVLTFVPLVNPFVVPVRVAYGEIGATEQALAVALSLLVLVPLVRLAARVYAGGLLHFGGRLGWRSAMRRGR